MEWDVSDDTSLERGILKRQCHRDIALGARLVERSPSERQVSGSKPDGG